MQTLDEELEFLKLYEEKWAKEVEEQVNQVMEKQQSFINFLKTWEKAIGKENIISIKTKYKGAKNGIIQLNRRNY